jgi:hypothetical protein
VVDKEGERDTAKDGGVLGGWSGSITWLLLVSGRTQSICWRVSHGSPQDLLTGGSVVGQDVGVRGYTRKEWQVLIESFSLDVTASHHVLEHRTRVA